MNYLAIAFLIFAAIYPLNYAKYNFSKKLYLQGLGMILIVLVMLLLPTVMLFSR